MQERGSPRCRHKVHLFLAVVVVVILFGGFGLMDYGPALVDLPQISALLPLAEPHCRCGRRSQT